MIYLGFDTSNYTTSVSAYSKNDSVNIRRLLDVKQGERGLRQSDALFQHLKTLPLLYEELCKKTDIKSIRAVAVSTKPRNIEGSYMPVFLAGEGYARVVSDTLGVPLLRLSHQDGHIMAGISSLNAFELLNKPFISVHLSGGTCEILLTNYISPDFRCEIIGGTLDISAGQLIDRVGVKMGMSFPCGKELESFALTADKYIPLPSNVKDSFINFSGIETKTLSLIGKCDNNNLAYSLLISIATSLSKALAYCINKYGISDVLIVGGVISNSVVKKYIKDNLNANIYFATPEAATDNALGIAQLCKNYYEKE